MNRAGMTEAQAQFADRLAEEVQAVLGPTMTIEVVAIIGDGPVTIVADCRTGDRLEPVTGRGSTLLDASRDLITAAAELRLGAAWQRLMETT
jgi:hypothetical protein